MLAPHDPLQAEVSHRLRPPGWDPRGTMDNPLGTDQLGRDVLSRVVYGTRVSLLVGTAATLISGVLGVTLGLVCAFRGGKLDALIMRIADVQLAFPFMLLAIAIVAVLGRGLLNVIVVLGVTGWVSYGRVVRGQALSVRQTEYVEAARAIGNRELVAMARHVLTERDDGRRRAGDLQRRELHGGRGQPDLPRSRRAARCAELGHHASRQPGVYPGRVVDRPFPGLALMVTVLSVNLMGDWLRQYLDPRLRHIQG